MIKRIFCLQLIFLLLVVGSNLWGATTGKVAGRVTDNANGEPLPGANVMIVGTSLGAATDVDGNYFILNVPPGTYSVRVTMMGYTTVTKTDVRVKIDLTSVVDFVLEPTVIEGAEVTVVSERPPVEVDLTASKARISGEEISNSWVTKVDEAVVMQSGVNIHGGIRGGFGLDVTYVVDGQEIRDGGTNSALVTVPTSSIQEMELLTGGWNAEYPQASSGIVNIVTKSGKQRLHGSLRYRYRPAGKYHWGRNIYSKDNWEWWEVNPDGTPGYNSLEYWETHDGGAEIFQNMTAQERLALWRKFITSKPTLTEYAERADWDIEGNIYGPITSKIGFMISGRWEEGAPIFPNAFSYSPTWNVLGKLDFDLAENTNLMVTGWGWGTHNGMASVGIWHSTEMVGFRNNPKGWFYSPYNVSKYFPWGGSGYGGGEDLGRLRPPEYINQYSGQAKLTHVFSPSTFMEASVKHYQLKYRSDHLLAGDAGFYTFQPDEGNVAGITDIPNAVFMANGYFTNVGSPNDQYFSDAWTNNTSLKIDFTSQLNPIHQLKAGASFSSYFVDRERGVNWIGERQSTVYGTTSFKPWEAALYVQDKIELKGMIINAGLRLDMFNVNKKVNYTITDPLAISDHTLGNEEISMISFDPDSRWAVHTPTQYAISPRIGISHPISANTVLHFMYGHFNQRPGWLKIGAQGAMSQQPDDPDPSEHQYTEEERKSLREGEPVRYNHGQVPQNNPALTYEKMIQYEVGFEQNIVDLLTLDVTMFYKDAKNMTSLGFQSDRAIDNFDFTTDINTWLWSDPTNYQAEGIPHLNRFNIPINGGYYNSRGIEFTLETRFMRNINLRVVYNMLYTLSGKYGLSNYYRDFEDGTKLNVDTFWGGRNSDGGSSGNTNERWNPRQTFKFVANFNSPEDFGPEVFGVRLLNNWNLNVFAEVATGQKFTYHSALKGDYSTEPDNETWKTFSNTNLKLAKRIKLTQSMNVELTMDITNVFNQHYLRLPGVEYGTFADLENYMENGELPKVPQTGEDDVWNWYSMNQLPRQIYFGIGFEF